MCVRKRERERERELRIPNVGCVCACRALAYSFLLLLNPKGETHRGVGPRVKSLAQQYSDRLTYLQHIEAHPPAMKSRKENIVYYRIAEHYK